MYGQKESVANQRMNSNDNLLCNSWFSGDACEPSQPLRKPETDPVQPAQNDCSDPNANDCSLSLGQTASQLPTTQPDRKSTARHQRIVPLAPLPVTLPSLLCHPRQLRLLPTLLLPQWWWRRLTSQEERRSSLAADIAPPGPPPCRGPAVCCCCGGGRRSGCSSKGGDSGGWCRPHSKESNVRQCLGVPQGKIMIAVAYPASPTICPDVLGFRREFWYLLK